MMLKTLCIYMLMMVCLYGYGQTGKTFFKKNDTISPNYNVCNQLLPTNGFFEHKGLVISKNYTILDSCNLSGNVKYDILILSPVTQNDDDTSICTHNIRRLIIISKFDYNKNKKIQYISDNLVLNKFDSQSEPYIKGIEKYKNGFMLTFTIGSRIRCDLKMCFFSCDGRFYLEKIRTNYYTTDLRRKKNIVLYFKSNKSLELNKVKTLGLIKFPNW